MGFRSFRVWSGLLQYSKSRKVSKSMYLRVRDSEEIGALRPRQLSVPSFGASFHLKVCLEPTCLRMESETFGHVWQFQLVTKGEKFGLILVKELSDIRCNDSAYPGQLWNLPAEGNRGRSIEAAICVS